MEKVVDAFVHYRLSVNTSEYHPVYSFATPELLCHADDNRV